MQVPFCVHLAKAKSTPALFSAIGDSSQEALGFCPLPPYLLTSDNLHNSASLSLNTYHTLFQNVLFGCRTSTALTVNCLFPLQGTHRIFAPTPFYRIAPSIISSSNAFFFLD